jgi:hypothetical protein
MTTVTTFIDTFNTSNFSWKGNSGVVSLTDLPIPAFARMPQILYVKSSKSGTTKMFSQIYYDASDGESWLYESDDGITVTILNN